MEELRELVKHTNDENTKKKILEILQTWGMAFRNSPKYRIVTVSTLEFNEVFPNSSYVESGQKVHKRSNNSFVIVGYFEFNESRRLEISTC